MIQRLFATAMTLMSAIKITEQRDVAARVRRAVDELDDTIRQIRSTIFALQVTPGVRGLRAHIQPVIDKAEEILGFAPETRLDGTLDMAVDDEVVVQVPAVLAEALSNVARHARAGRVSVVVSAGDELVVRVTDDGIGFRPGGRRAACGTWPNAPSGSAGRSGSGPGRAAARCWNGGFPPAARSGAEAEAPCRGDERPVISHRSSASGAEAPP